MEQEQLEYRALTFSELEAMLRRHADNLQVAKVIEDAMARRLSDVPKGVTSSYDLGQGKPTRAGWY